MDAEARSGQREGRVVSDRIAAALDGLIVAAQSLDVVRIAEARAKVLNLFDDALRLPPLEMGGIEIRAAEYVPPTEAWFVDKLGRVRGKIYNLPRTTERL